MGAATRQLHNPVPSKRRIGNDGGPDGAAGPHFSLSANGFSRDGFVFAGWSDSPTGDALYSNGAEVVNLANDPGGVATLYALWRERGGAAGLAIAYYDTSSSSFSTYSAMTSFFFVPDADTGGVDDRLRRYAGLGHHGDVVL